MPAAAVSPTSTRPIAIARHASAVGWWEIATAPAAPAVRHVAASYSGWIEQMATPLVRRELPTEYAPLMFSFGDPIRLHDHARPADYTEVRSFITGAYDRTQLVGSAGVSGGVQINLTLLGIRRLVGRPLGDLKNRAVSLEEVFGAGVRTCVARIEDAAGWETRFRLVDQFMTARLAIDSTVPPEVRAAWRLLADDRGGRRRVRDVAAAVGWSQKHLIARFQHEIGLAPRQFARLLRFGRVVQALKSGQVAPLADIALASGYYDQSHLNRDSREFAGAAPGELVRKLLPDGGGIVL